MKAIQVNGAIKKFASLPKVWTDENGTHLNIKDGQAYGFYNVVTPTYDSATQLLGDIQWDADSNTFTYPVLDKNFLQTLEEMKASRIDSLKTIIGNELAKTDWYVTRLNEKETAIINHHIINTSHKFYPCPDTIYMAGRKTNGT